MALRTGKSSTRATTIGVEVTLLHNTEGWGRTNKGKKKREGL